MKENILAKHPQVSSEDRTYVDFVINGISLTELLGGVGDYIGKFGWKTNPDFENEYVFRSDHAAHSC